MMRKFAAVQAFFPLSDLYTPLMDKIFLFASSSFLGLSSPFFTLLLQTSGLVAVVFPRSYFLVVGGVSLRPLQYTIPPSFFFPLGFARSSEF